MYATPIKSPINAVQSDGHVAESPGPVLGASQCKALALFFKMINPTLFIRVLRFWIVACQEDSCVSESVSLLHVIFASVSVYLTLVCIAA